MLDDDPTVPLHKLKAKQTKPHTLQCKSNGAKPPLRPNLIRSKKARCSAPSGEVSRSLYNSGFDMLGKGQQEKKGLEIGFMIRSVPEHPDKGRQ